MTEYLSQASYSACYREGSDAFSMGLDRDECPYSRPEFREAWLAGYDEAASLASSLFIY